MKRRFTVIAFALIVLCCFGIFLLRHMHPPTHRSTSPLSTQQLRAAIDKAGGNEVLQTEATKAILNETANGTGTTNCPAISTLASLVGGQILDVEPDGTAGVGVPAHVLIRRGSHFDYQFIYIFGSGSVPSTNNLKIEMITGGIYLRNTSLTQ